MSNTNGQIHQEVVLMAQAFCQIKGVMEGYQTQTERLRRRGPYANDFIEVNQVNQAN
jgi:hypothetical protein